MLTFVLIALIFAAAAVGFIVGRKLEGTQIEDGTIHLLEDAAHRFRFYAKQHLDKLNLPALSEEQKQSTVEKADVNNRAARIIEEHLDRLY